ncbi:MAG: HAD family phosphatase [Parachlamydiales bacterium]|jgi:HAD superfamily hydrolase (TIGR01509 family)
MTNFLFSEQSIKAIIFDCDGTLVDSEDAHLSAWRKAVENRGHVLTFEQCLLYTGKPATFIAKLIAEAIGHDNSEDILSEKRSHYRELHQQGLPPIQGTVEFLKRLAADKERLNLKLAVASAAPKDEILSNLRHLGIEEHFDIILSGQDDLKEYSDPEGVNKPKPYIYLHTAKLLNVLPSECVVIEDSTTGVLAGMAAGCITIAVPNEFTKMQDLSEASMKIENLSSFSVDHFLQTVSAAGKK